MQTLLAFFVVLGILIVVHELGHYLVARWCGVKVLRFSVGMGKVIFSRRFGPDQTEWALSILPFGGYVKMLDAREQDAQAIPEEDLKREFTRQTVWRRIAIVAAGPIANFLLAILIFAGLYSYGIPEPVPKLRAVPVASEAYTAGLRGGERIVAINGKPVEVWSDVRWQFLQLGLQKASVELQVQRPDGASAEFSDSVTLRTDSLSAEDMEKDFLTKLGLDLALPKAFLGTVIADGPGMQAGLQEGDLVLSIDGKPVNDGRDLIEIVRASPNQPLGMQILRDQQQLMLTVTPASTSTNGTIVGQIKVEVPMMPEMIIASAAPGPALVKAVGRTWDTSLLTLRMLGKMVIGEVSWKNVTGPITIADYAGKTARIGLISFLSFIALISISLGVMNLLPIPVLDGGLLLYYSLEVVTGKPVSARFAEIAQRAGIGILMMLMTVAVFNDIVRLIS